MTAASLPSAKTHLVPVTSDGDLGERINELEKEVRRLRGAAGGSSS